MISLLIAILGQTTEGLPDQSGQSWLLLLGLWNDAGVWHDGSSWNDGS